MVANTIRKVSIIETVAPRPATTPEVAAAKLLICIIRKYVAPV